MDDGQELRRAASGSSCPSGRTFAGVRPRRQRRGGGGLWRPASGAERRRAPRGARRAHPARGSPARRRLRGGAARSSLLSPDAGTRAASRQGSGRASSRSRRHHRPRPTRRSTRWAAATSAAGAPSSTSAATTTSTLRSSGRTWTSGTGPGGAGWRRFTCLRPSAITRAPRPSESVPWTNARGCGTATGRSSTCGTSQEPAPACGEPRRVGRLRSLRGSAPRSRRAGRGAGSLPHRRPEARGAASPTRRSWPGCDEGEGAFPLSQRPLPSVQRRPPPEPRPDPGSRPIRLRGGLRHRRPGDARTARAREHLATPRRDARRLRAHRTGSRRGRPATTPSGSPTPRRTSGARRSRTCCRGASRPCSSTWSTSKSW